MRLRRSVLVCVSLGVLFAVAASGASAAQPKNCGSFRVLHNDKIDNHAVAKGLYRLDALGVSCKIVAGDYGLFDQFITQSATTSLPLPWKYSVSKRRLKFAAKAGAYFTATKVATKALARRAQGPKNAPCRNFKVASDQTIDKRVFLKGTYQINAFGISCAKVIGKYGLFDQFLTQNDSRALPKPWSLMATISMVAVGQPKFEAKSRVGFRAQRISG